MPYIPKAFVHTWGTHWGDSNYAVATRSGNVGHASLSVRFAADDKGKELVEKYCRLNGIPHHLRSSQTAGEPYYEVYFSYWPGSEAYPYSLKTDLQEDQVAERLGVQFDWKDDFKKDKGIEIDRRGKKTLSPAVIIHNLPKDNPELKEKLIEYGAGSNELRKKNNEIWKIKSKGKDYKKNVKKMEVLETDIENIKKALSKIRLKRGDIPKDSPQQKDLKEQEIIQSKKLKEKFNAQEAIKLGSPDLTKVAALEEEVKILEERMRVIERSLKSKNVFDQYVTKGAPPEQTVELPIKHGNVRGLDLEGLLQGMVKVTQNTKGYSLYSSNCSAAVATALNSGIPASEAALHKKFKLIGSLGIATPQSVFAGATKGSALFQSPKAVEKTILQKFKNWLQDIKLFFGQKKNHDLVLFSAGAIQASSLTTSKDTAPLEVKIMEEDKKRMERPIDDVEQGSSSKLKRT
jgi:hypothetical protein